MVRIGLDNHDHAAYIGPDMPGPSLPAVEGLRPLVAKNIRLAMGNRSSAGVALALGHNERTVRRWRSGERTPDIDTLSALGAELGRDVAWFFVDHESTAARAA